MKNFTFKPSDYITDDEIDQIGVVPVESIVTRYPESQTYSIEPEAIPFECFDYDSMIPSWLLQLNSVKLLKDNKRYKVTPNCKIIYGLLKSIGGKHGRENIYPNVDQICNLLSIRKGTVIDCLDILETVGLIKKHPRQIGQKKYSNRYELFTPSYYKWGGRIFYNSQDRQLAGKYFP